MKPRLKAQLRFLEETDALKAVSRRTRPIGASRRENSAEHSWQAALAAMLLAEHADEDLDLCRVLQMLLIHDLPEVDVGDVFHYEKESAADLHARELAATRRLLSVLPEEQQRDYLQLWQEFESRQTPEARFAAAVDRFVAFLVNRGNHGGTWVEYQLAATQVLEKNAHIVDASQAIWEAVEEIVKQAVAAGQLSGDDQDG